jgi:hypothetical protein
MPDRYENPWRDDPYRYGREDRGFIDRAGDRAWPSDEEAERRRRMDEQERQRYYARESAPYYEDRWRSGGFWPDDYGRIEYDRPGPGFAGDRTWRDRGVPRGYRGEPARETSRRGPYSYDYVWPYWPYYGGPGPSAPGRERYFAGRGPKGYQRPDNRINEDVCDRLADAPDVDASEIEVTVKNGEVTLSGTVDDRQDKRRAEDLAETVSGVREVHNHLRVGRAQEPSVGTAAGETGAAKTRH